MTKITSFIVLILFLIPNISFCDITFTDGKWETTFDCAEYEQTVNSLSCNDLSPGLTNGEQYDGDPQGSGCQSGNAEIHSRANNPLGAGRGFIHKACGTMSPLEMQASSTSGGIIANFPSTETDIWIRWYMKFESGFALVGDRLSFKIMFVNGLPMDPIPKYEFENSFGIQTQGSPTATRYYDDTAGWLTTMGGVTGDGDWHYYEMRISTGTTSTNGIMQFWIDERLMYEKTDCDFEESPISDIRFGSNMQGVDGDFEIFYDDIILYNKTPPNVDTEGNPRIGPIPTGTNPVVELQVDFSTSTSPTTYTGTATAETGRTITGVVSSNGYTVTPDDGVWDELEEVFTVSGVIPTVTDTCTATDSSAETGNDSITVTLTVSSGTTKNGFGSGKWGR